MELTIGNMNAIAFHLEQGEDNGGISKEALASFLRGASENCDALQTALAEKEKENKRLRDALEFYANQDNWNGEFFEDKAVIDDCGKIAREALEVK